MLKRYNALIHTRPALSEWADVVIAADHEQAMKEKEEQIASLQLYKDATLNKESERERQISALTEELRLSGLRGDSLDRVIEEGVQKELALEAENEHLKKEAQELHDKYGKLWDKWENTDLQRSFVVIENKVLREQNSAMNASLVVLRPENELLRSKIKDLTSRPESVL